MISRLYTTSAFQGFSALQPLEKGIAYHIRLATFEDIPSIQHCNRKTLPENYSFEYFQTQLMNFPDLAFVAERIDSNTLASQSNSDQKIGFNAQDIDRQTSRGWDRHIKQSFTLENVKTASNIMAMGRNKEIMGYALGRLEYPHYQEIQLDPTYQRSATDPGYQGHVLSLAVYDEHRGLGVAKKLMNSLHQTLAFGYSVECVTLKCRVSNIAALRLYTEHFAYQTRFRIPNYYSNAIEDGWHLSLTGLQDKMKLDKKQVAESIRPTNKSNRFYQQ